jgi:hypothetical protein
LYWYENAVSNKDADGLWVYKAKDAIKELKAAGYSSSSR